MFHLYQTIIYEAILLMLFYTEDRWAYMTGILATAAWLVLAFERLAGGGLPPIVPIDAVPSGDQSSELGRGNHGTSLPADDRFLRVSLEAALLRARKKPEHFSDYPGRSGGVLRYPCSLFWNTFPKVTT